MENAQSVRSTTCFERSKVNSKQPSKAAFLMSWFGLFKKSKKLDIGVKMLDNEILKEKLKTDLKKLNLSKDEEEIIVRELNYLSNLLIDIYINKTKKKTQYV
jgi:hypothetical protein